MRPVRPVHAAEPCGSMVLQFRVSEMASSAGKQISDPKGVPEAVGLPLPDERFGAHLDETSPLSDFWKVNGPRNGLVGD